jgi:methylmalonyl-CoA mutase N-terminal domain/subunit
MGGSVPAIEREFIQNEIAHSAYQHQRQVETHEKIIVGVNKYQLEQEPEIPILRVDDSIRQVQSAKLDALRAQRDHARVDRLLQELSDRAVSGENLMPAVIEAVENKCTLGEIADTLREVFGEYK